MFAHGQTVVRQRATVSLDPYRRGGRAEDWSAPEVIDIEGAWVASSSSTSRADATRQQIITDKSLYCPPDSDVQAFDRIVVGGDIYKVEARPSADTNPFTGWQPVMECPLTLVEG
jgi:hypothetical protein